MDKMDKKINESLLRDNSKRQMTELNRTIKKAGGDIQDIVRRSEKTKEDKMPNAYYMDNPFDTKRKSIQTWEDFTKGDAHYKSVAMKSRDPKPNRPHTNSNLSTLKVNETIESGSLKTMNAHFQTFVYPFLTKDEQIIVKRLDVVLFRYNYDKDVNVRLSFKSPMSKDDSFQLMIVGVSPEIYNDIVKIVEKFGLVSDYDDKNKLYLNIYHKKEKGNRRTVNEELKFSDGMEFDTSGTLRKEKREDGWYVIGNRMIIPVKDEEEADEYLNNRLDKLPKNAAETISRRVKKMNYEKNDFNNYEVNESKKSTKKESFIPITKLKNLKNFYEICKDGDCTKKSNTNDDSWVKGTKEDKLRPMFKNLPDTNIRPPYDILRAGKWMTLFGKEGRVNGIKDGILLFDIVDDNDKPKTLKYNLDEVMKELKKSNKKNKK